MRDLEINFVGSGNAVNVNSLANTPLSKIFGVSNQDIGMSSFIFEINRNFELEKSSTNDIYNIYNYASSELNCKLKIRVSKDPDFIKINQAEYDKILQITKRNSSIKRGVVYQKTAKKVLSPGKIALVTLVSAVVIIGGTMVVKAVAESSKDPNSVFYNATHYVSTTPGVPTEVKEAELRQYQQEMINQEHQENNIFYK